MSKLMVIYVTARIEVHCEDQSISPMEVFEELDYNFDFPAAGAEVIETELVEFTVAD